MKVDPSSDVSRNLPVRGTPTDEGPADAKFKTILEQKMEPRPAQKIDQNTLPTNPEMIHELDFRPMTMVDGKALVQQVETFLDKLEVYQQQLMDPDISLKALSPLVDRIRADGEHLSSFLNKFDAQDGMQDILSQTLITASLEVIRFNRGDYNG